MEVQTDEVGGCGGSRGSRWRSGTLMTQYLPHSTKKLAILQRRELALVALIRANASQDKIVAAAEEVRAARIRAIEARVASDGSYAVAPIYADQIEMIRKLPVETILAYFGYSNFHTEESNPG